MVAKCLLWRNRVMAVLLCVLVASCASAERRATKAFAERSVSQLYDEAFYYIDRKRWSAAAEIFNEIERQHPYSEWAQRSMLMASYALYRSRRHSESIISASRYVSLFPGGRDAPYAYYLVALNYYAQMLEIRRDQENTKYAMGALNELIARFPNSEYANDARLKLDLVRDQLAGKEMYSGLYYMHQELYLAALKRFSSVVTDYQGTTHVPEALHRMVEIWLTLGIDEEAVRAAAILGYNYPDDPWYERSYALIGQYGLTEGVKR